MDARQDWLQRVLGFTLPAEAQATGHDGSAAPGAAADWAGARAVWESASEAVDGQITGLQAALRATGDETMKHIAEFGMNGLTGDHKVKLMAAMMEIGAGDPESLAKAGPKALGIIQAFRTHIDSDERIEVCDDNPFGVAVSIRATLAPALAQLEAALQAVPGA